jgi:hypothetical protein
MILSYRHTRPVSMPAPYPVWLKTALVHGLTVVTPNVADSGSTGVALINPWDTQ